LIAIVLLRHALPRIRVPVVFVYGTADPFGSIRELEEAISAPVKLLRIEGAGMVAVKCRSCGHVAELPVTKLKAKLSPNEFVKHLGAQFRCQRCNHKGAEVDATRALGYYG
jgi:predicted alpha/beta-hydrolase family hydrolase